MNLQEFLDKELPSDRLLSYHPPSIDSIAYKAKANIKKARGRKIEQKDIKVGDTVKVKEGDGTEKEYKVLRLIHDQFGVPVKAVVSLPGGLDKRIVSIRSSEK